MKITRLTLQTGQLEATAAFYETVLGLPVVQTAQNTIAVQAGATIIHFEAVPAAVQPEYHIAFNIPHNQIHEALAWLRQRVPVIDITPGQCVADFKDWNAHAIYFYDNNGNILELIARHDMDNASERPFEPASILSVSEAGIVTEHPEQLAQQLHQQYGLPWFSKSKPSAHFVPMGDDEGLLIIVKTGRNWYATQQPSRACYMRLHIQQGEQTLQLEVNKSE
jgi:catechol-2,3-dioxygenase